MTAAVIFTTLGAATSAQADDSGPLFGLIDAAVQRLHNTDPVAAVKWQTTADIADPPRVEKVLADVTAQANVRTIDATYVRRFFTDQFDATEAIKYARLCNGPSTRV